jgi:hypothetical protein
MDTTIDAKIDEDITWRQTFMNILIEQFHSTEPTIEPASVGMATLSYRMSNDDFGTWLRENVEYSPHSAVGIRQLCVAYQPELSTANNHKINTYKTQIETFFSEAFPDVPIRYTQHRVNDKNMKGWSGFVLKRQDLD